MKTDYQLSPKESIKLGEPALVDLHGNSISSGSQSDEGRAQSYWDLFYEKQKTQSPPSQFAAFTATEYKQHPLIIDIGCGNGRDISDLDLNHSLFKAVQQRKKLIYSRFFLHAIQEQKEDELFEFIIKLCQHPEDAIALEFRTKEDEHNPKQAQAHFRRFIAPRDLQLKLETKFKLNVSYQVQGYGLAKYGAEDAHVCRMLLTLNN